MASPRRSRPKRILILTYGTRGDVEPLLALALGLRAAGYETAIGTSTRFAGWLEQHGIRALAMTDASLAVLDTAEGRALVEGRMGLARRTVTGLRLKRDMSDVTRQLLADAWAAAQAFEPDAIVYQAKVFAAPHIAEKLGIPAFFASLQPMFVPTGAFPAAGMPALPLPDFNRLTYWLVERVYGAYRRTTNAFRDETLGLGPISRGRAVLFPGPAGSIPVLTAISPQVLPRPADWPEAAWMTGFWRLPGAPDAALTADLEAFLQAGPPPVYVGFGSMPSADPKALGRIVVEAVRQAGVRAVVATGWGGLDIEAGAEMLVIDRAPHDRLFPRMAAVVHHGGAGTTAAGFTAGVPSVICPFFGDQPFWARRSVALGVGAPPVPRGRLTAGRLARSIRRAVDDGGIVAKAAALGRALRGEDGVARAVELIAARLDR